MSNQPFTAQQIADWHRYEDVNRAGYNMDFPYARRLVKLPEVRYDFVQARYRELAIAVIAQQQKQRTKQ